MMKGGDVATQRYKSEDVERIEASILEEGGESVD